MCKVHGSFNSLYRLHINSCQKGWFLVHEIFTKNLACAANAIGAEIVQVSTDYVFDGEGSTVLTEFDEVNQ